LPFLSLLSHNILQLGVSQPTMQRVSQVLANLLGANKFASDKSRVREAIRLYLSGNASMYPSAVKTITLTVSLITGLKNTILPTRFSNSSTVENCYHL